MAVFVKQPWAWHWLCVQHGGHCSLQRLAAHLPANGTGLRDCQSESGWSVSTFTICGSMEKVERKICKKEREAYIFFSSDIPPSLCFSRSVSVQWWHRCQTNPGTAQASSLLSVQHKTEKGTEMQANLIWWILQVVERPGYISVHLQQLREPVYAFSFCLVCQFQELGSHSCILWDCH